MICCHVILVRVPSQELVLHSFIPSLIHSPYLILLSPSINHDSGGGWGKTIAFGAASWFLGGKIHSKRAVSKANKKAAQEKKELYAQYYKDVLALQNQNAELIKYIDETAKLQQDSEFAAADRDGDNRVSRAEFNMYKNQYLQLHPEMASQFPKFEDFDPDSNGLISKAEYDAYYKNLGL